MEKKPRSTPEMWLMLYVGMGSGFCVVSFTLLASTRPITANGLLGLGLGIIGVAILGYLWKTRENYKDALVGD